MYNSEFMRGRGSSAAAGEANAICRTWISMGDESARISGPGHGTVSYRTFAFLLFMDGCCARLA